VKLGVGLHHREGVIVPVPDFLQEEIQIIWKARSEGILWEGILFKGRNDLLNTGYNRL
jgi:hypothetical protein